MDKSKRNSLAGSHESYDKRGMSEAARKKKLAYDSRYQKTKKRVKYREQLNKFNRKHGKKGDGLDASHDVSGNLALESQKKNRARNGSGSNPTKRKK